MIRNSIPYGEDLRAYFHQKKVDIDSILREAEPIIQGFVSKKKFPVGSDNRDEVISNALQALMYRTYTAAQGRKKSLRRSMLLPFNLLSCVRDGIREAKESRVFVRAQGHAPRERMVLFSRIEEENKGRKIDENIIRFPSNERSTVERAIAREELRRVNASSHQFDPRERVIWGLNQRGKLTYAQIGDLVGLTESRVAQIIGRMRKRFAIDMVLNAPRKNGKSHSKRTIVRKSFLRKK